MTDDNSSLMEYDDFHKQDEALFEVFYGDLHHLLSCTRNNNNQDRDSFSTMMQLDISYISALDDIAEGDEQEVDVSNSLSVLHPPAAPDLPASTTSNLFFLLIVHKIHQKSLYRTMMHTFLYWKTILTQCPSVWTQDLDTIRRKADLYVSNTQLSTVMNTQLQTAFTRLFHVIEKSTKQYEQFEKFQVWKQAHSWQGCQLQQSPRSLRLLTSIPHTVLWCIFCEYCSKKKKKLPTYDKPKKLFGFQVAKTKSSASQSTIANDDDGEKFYHKLILSYADVMQMMHDFKLDAHFDKQKVESTLRDIADAHLNTSTLTGIELERKPSSSSIASSIGAAPRLSKKKSKSSMFGSFFSLKAIGIRKTHTERISFHTFNKLLWTLQLERVNAKMTVDNVRLYKQTILQDPEKGFKALRKDVAATGQWRMLLQPTATA